jgi:hypothetical protein
MFQFRGALVGLVHRGLGLGDPTGHRRRGPPDELLLKMEQVRRMVGLQVRAGVLEQPRALVTGRLHDLDGKIAHGGGQLLAPRLAVAPVSILFQQDEARGCFHGHQARLGVEGLILEDGDLFGLHLLAQPLGLLIAEVAQLMFQLGDGLLLKAVGAGHEAVEPAELQKGADRPDATGVHLSDDGLNGQNDATKQVHALGAFEELDRGRRSVDRGLACDLVLESGPRNADHLGEVTLTGSEWFRGVLEGADGSGDLLSGLMCSRGSVLVVDGADLLHLWFSREEQLPVSESALPGTFLSHLRRFAM